MGGSVKKATRSVTKFAGDPKRVISATTTLGGSEALRGIQKNVLQGGPKLSVPGGTVDATALRAQMMQDLALGKAIGEERFKEGDLGRLEGVSQADIKDIFARRRAAMEEGLGREELQARREEMGQRIDQQTQSAVRQLASMGGQLGLRGGTLGTQAANMLAAGAQGKSDIERQLFLADADARRQALGAAEASLGGALRENIDAANRERFARLSTELGIGQMGVAQRGGATAANAALQAAAISRPRPGLLTSATGGLTVLCTECHRQGYIDNNIFKADVKFGKRIRKEDPEAYQGYLIWASPVVKKMQESKLVTKLVASFVVPFAKHIAYTEGHLEKDNLVGKMVCKVGKAFSRLVFKLHRGNYGENHVRRAG